jgi:hypothetical protein
MEREISKDSMIDKMREGRYKRCPSRGNSRIRERREKQRGNTYLDTSLAEMDRDNLTHVSSCRECVLEMNDNGSGRGKQEEKNRMRKTSSVQAASDQNGGKVTDQGKDIQ